MSKKYFIIIILLFNVIFHSKAYEIKIIAKVNNEIITNIDLSNRLKMALSLSNLPDDLDIREKLKPRVLDSIINETLKIQEANRLGIFVSNQEVMSQINILEKRLGIDKNKMLEDYKEKGIPEITILNQIRSQLLWQKILYNVVIQNTTVSEKKILETYDLIVKKSGETEYNISEIFVSSDNMEAEERINSIYSRVNNQNFLLLAEQFSDGVVFLGNIQNNWVRESLLDNNIKDGITDLRSGQISRPIKSTTGYHIILLNDKRKTKKIKENQKLFDLSQILFKMKKSGDKKEEDYYTAFLLDLSDLIDGCDDLSKLIEEVPEGFGGRLGKVEAENIRKEFIEAVNNLPTGKLSQAIITEDGVHGLMLCSPISSNSYEELKQNIETSLRSIKIDSAAQSLLNRVRRKALIEISEL